MQKAKKVVGAPRKYTPESFKREVNRYFLSISRVIELTEKVEAGTDEDGKPIYKHVPIYNSLGEQATKTEYFCKPTICALCSALKIHPSTFCEYAKKEEYSDVCAAAKLECEAYLADRLGTGKGDSGIKFELEHNYGWSGRVEVEVGAETRKSMRQQNMTMQDKLALLSSLGLTLPEDDSDEA